MSTSLVPSTGTVIEAVVSLEGPLAQAILLCDELVVSGVLATVLSAATNVTNATGGGTSCSGVALTTEDPSGRVLQSISSAELAATAASSPNCSLGIVGNRSSSSNGSGVSVYGVSGAASAVVNITIFVVVPYGGLVDAAVAAITSLSGASVFSSHSFEAVVAALANVTGCAATSFTFGYVRVASMVCGGGARAESCRTAAAAAAALPALEVAPFAGTPAGITIIALSASAVLALAATGVVIALVRHCRNTAERASLLYFFPVPAPGPQDEGAQAASLAQDPEQKKISETAQLAAITAVSRRGVLAAAEASAVAAADASPLTSARTLRVLAAALPSPLLGSARRLGSRSARSRSEDVVVTARLFASRVSLEAGAVGGGGAGGGAGSAGEFDTARSRATIDIAAQRADADEYAKGIADDADDDASNDADTGIEGDAVAGAGLGTRFACHEAGVARSSSGVSDEPAARTAARLLLRQLAKRSVTALAASSSPGLSKSDDARHQPRSELTLSLESSAASAALKAATTTVALQDGGEHSLLVSPQPQPPQTPVESVGAANAATAESSVS